MMNDSNFLSRLARRTFLSRIGVGAAALAALPSAAGSSPVAEPTPWQPARHAEDDWFDAPAAKHRFFIDTTEGGPFGQAIAWSRNFLEASASGYSLTDADNAIIICARHFSTPFAFTDAMWAKHGALFSERGGGFVDPKTKAAPTINVYLVGTYGEALRNNGFTLDSLLKRGVRLAVCGMATRRLAGLIAKKDGTSADDVFKELTQNMVANAHIVPAGIVAVNRAQERGYTAATVV